MVALIVLGPEQLPGALRQMGRFLGQVQQWSAGLREQMENVVAFEQERASTNTGNGEGRAASPAPQPDVAPPPPDTLATRDPSEETP